VRATARSRYGTGLAAHLIASKFCLSTPIHRLEKQLRSHGIPVSRSTLNELVNRVAETLRPVYDVLCAEVSRGRVVHADETPIKLMSHNKQGFIWVFLSGEVIVYKFAEGRGSETAVKMLGGTDGVLVTDGYSGYLPVTGAPAGTEPRRVAAACLAHIRRKFHEALSTAPQAQAALDLILEVYRVEREVAATGMTGSEAHLRLRQTRSAMAMGRLKKWMRTQSKFTPPKSPLGKALSYALRRWQQAVRFLYDASVPVDNNVSERALRVVALGRKNFNGVGSKEGGRALEVLYSLVASCEAAGVEPFAYLRDVIARAHEDPATLTPKAWAPATPVVG
jgi:transposase